MSKRIKGLLQKELTGRLTGVESVAVINPRGLDANKNNEMRRKLHGKGLRMTVVKNTLARRAAPETGMVGFEKLLDGPSALIYVEDGAAEKPASIADLARMLMDAKKENDALEFRGIFFDGDIYEGDAGVSQVSKLPTREEAIGTVIACALSPGRKLAGIFKGAGNVAGLVKAVEEKKKAEGGEPAEAAAEAA